MAGLVTGLEFKDSEGNILLQVGDFENINKSVSYIDFKLDENERLIGFRSSNRAEFSTTHHFDL
jgi:hypothetical protein